jgi:hypothetical protein
MYPTACNYAPHAERDDLSCEWDSCIQEGCTYSEALNFDPAADRDNGTCAFEEVCMGDLNQDGAITSNDLLSMLSVFGQYCN